MIDYPLTTLIQAGIREIPIISTEQDVPPFPAMPDDGGQWDWGIKQSRLSGRAFLTGVPAALVPGDFMAMASGRRWPRQARSEGATIFACHVGDSQRYGVAEFDAREQAWSIEEKPVTLKSHYAVTGLYFHDGDACDTASGLRSSARGELESTDINQA